jgi:CubicO group peptidase (beta-lactamase class C family)
MRALVPVLYGWLLLTSVAVGPAQAQERKKPRAHPDHAKLAATTDHLVERFMSEHHVPGAVVAVIRDGEVIVEKGYGVRSQDDSQRPDADTLFYIGSLSKAVTAVGVELLAERGKLSLDDPLGRYIKGLPKPWQPIPLKYVLAHQSGIPELPNKKPFEEMLRSAADTPLTFKPGTKQLYNNFNFALAGKVIEAAAGKPYLEFMKAEVFHPLGMNRTGYGQVDKNSAPGYRAQKNGTHEVVRGGGPAASEYGIPSGFIQTTLADLLRLYHGIERHTPLTPKRTREMISPVTPDLSGTPGWFVREDGGVTVVSKNGAAAGYSSQFQFVPGKGHVVIFIMNFQAPGLNTISLASDLLRDVCGLPVTDKHGKE